MTVFGDDGEIVWTGTTPKRRHTTAQRREIQARNQTCVFVGCRMPAVECDIDHNRAWVEGGPTSVENAAPLCRRNHRGKGMGWRLRQIRPGIYEWRSPLGHVYIVRPQPT